MYECTSHVDAAVIGLNADSFLDFALLEPHFSSEVTMLEDFMLREFFEIGGSRGILNESSTCFREYLIDLYKAADNEWILDKIDHYISTYNLDQEYSEFLRKRGE